jgi:hypothetical protein
MSDSSSRVSRVYADLELYCDDNIAKLNNPLPSRLTQQPSQAWLEFLFHTRCPLDKANEFLCVHDKFYWHSCKRCNRSPEGAKYWKAKLIPRLLTLLQTLQATKDTGQ